MNELKPEDVMRALERIASKANCNHMRHLEGCGCFCIRLGKNVDDMAKGRSHECNENCEHFSPPHIENVLRAALALLREKDAEIERLKAKSQLDDVAYKSLQELYDADVKSLSDHITALIETTKNARAEAINEFFERVCKEVEQTPNANEFFINAWKEKFEEIAKN